MWAAESSRPPGLHRESFSQKRKKRGWGNDPGRALEGKTEPELHSWNPYVVEGQRHLLQVILIFTCVPWHTCAHLHTHTHTM